MVCSRVSVATFIELSRDKVITDIYEWAEKERERRQQKATLGSLSAEVRKAFKLAAYEDEGDGMVEIMCAMYNNQPKVLKMGIPYDLGVMAPLKFAIVRWGTVQKDNLCFTVTETITGKAMGNGKTAELAIVDTRQKLARLDPEKLQAKVETILFEQAMAEATAMAVQLMGQLTDY